MEGSTNEGFELMGLLDRTAEVSFRDGVVGHAQVLEKELRRAGGRQEDERDRSWKLRLLVTVPGVEPYEVVHVCTIPWDRVPRTLQDVPVTVSASEPKRLRIEWEQAESLIEAAKLAQRLVEAGDLHAAAEAMRSASGRFTRRDAPEEKA